MILKRSDILTPGRVYTFTYESGEVLQDGDSWTLEQFRQYLADYGDVQSATRAFMSGRYAIVVIPSASYDLANWMVFFEYACQQMGWEDNRFIQAEGGGVSTQPGGATQIAVETVQGVTGTIGKATGAGLGALLRPLAPYIILAAGLWLAYEYTRSQRH